MARTAGSQRATAPTRQTAGIGLSRSSGRRSRRLLSSSLQKDSGGWQLGLPGWRPDRFPGSPTTTSMTLTRTGGPARSTGMT
jgi:hypothetical protein